MSAKDRRKGKLTKDSVTLLPCFYFVESDGTLLLYNKHAENLRDSNRGLTLPRSIMTFGYNVLGIRCTVLPILASSVVSLYFLELTDMFKPVLSGYTCYDRSLSLPYVEPTREMVPFLMLLSLAFAGPTATIMIGEGILYCCLIKRGYVAGTELNINAAGCNFNSYIRRAVRFVGVHVFGLCATALVTDTIQLSTGYHAPYFLTVCKPNYTTLSTSCEENSFILQDICSGTDPSVINAGRKSFPSQHATLAAFAAVYVSMYFNATLTDSSRLLKPALVFSFVMSAIICGLTRITQYKNHAVDVYLGFLIGGGMAVYLGLYAVGNFQPGEELSSRPTQPREVQQPPTDQRQESVRHLSIKSNSNSNGNPPRPESLISRNQRNTSSLTNLKRATANVEVITPRVPMGKESMVTFNTLPRVHTSALEDPTRRNATMHATMDANQSKQLLSQWKSKNDSCNLSLQVIETELSHSPQGSMEMRCNSEPAGVGINGDHQGPASQYMKLATSTSSGIAGGTRVSMPSRPSSTQLVHIPEETQESDNMSPKNSSTRSKWLSMAEKSVACSQPRIMQVIALSKQQGLLQGSPKSSSGSTVSCTGSIRYKTLTDQEPVNIVRVEAHPENNRSVVQGPTPNGDGSWKWNSQERVSPRQSYEFNNLNRGSESSGSPKDGSQHLHHQAVTTIRVTPVEGAEGTSETLSIASSQDSTLRRKGNVILIPERGSSPDNTRTIFYKGTSQSQAFGR